MSGGRWDRCRHCGRWLTKRSEPGGDYPGDNEFWVDTNGRAECDLEQSNQQHEPDLTPWSLT